MTRDLASATGTMILDTLRTATARPTLVTCPECEGYGAFVVGLGHFSDGSERNEERLCPECDGTGRVEQEVAPITQDDLPDPCWLTYYIGGAMITAQRCHNVNQAKAICPEVGQWIPYCYGWHSADCRTLILRDAAMGDKLLDEIEAEWVATHGSTLAPDFPRASERPAALRSKP